MPAGAGSFSSSWLTGLSIFFFARLICRDFHHHVSRSKRPGPPAWCSQTHRHGIHVAATRLINTTYAVCE
jgi:hypothetical protein